jgi:putative ATP-binding cassette transporter
MHLTRGHFRERFVALTRPFFRSEARWQAFGLLGVLLAFIFCLAWLNTRSNYLNRDFMTAVERRESGQVGKLALFWAGVFATLSVVGVFKTFAEERLRLRWREWLTRHLLGRYLARRAYYRMKARADVDNPDQRITEDVKTFTEQALSLFLILTNSTVTLIWFSEILWSITPMLFTAAVTYAAFGSVMTVVLGRRLIRLDVQQFKKEADFRYDLMQVRTRAEPVALLGGEREEAGRLVRGLGALVENMKGIVGLSRNIGFFTVGFDYMTQLIPLVIVVPYYIRGEVEFGMVTQGVMAFIFVMNAFSLIVKEFQRISTFGAVIERLGTFTEALDEETAAPARSPVETAVDEDRVAFEGLTLVTPKEGRVLLQDFSAEAPRGRRLLVLGPTGSGRAALLRAAAGLWTSGWGRVVRPPLDRVMFLPQQPYLRPGALRDQILYAVPGPAPSDDRIRAILRWVGFGPVLEREGGLDAERDWADTLSLGEQQELAFARLLLANPPFAFLEDVTSALERDRAYKLYRILAETPITFVSASSDPGLRDYHDATCELFPDGTWRAAPILNGNGNGHLNGALSLGAAAAAPAAVLPAPWRGG